MNCKPGDKAIIILPASASGGLVSVDKPCICEAASWQVYLLSSVEIDGERHCAGEGCCWEDKFLRPLPDDPDAEPAPPITAPVEEKV